MSNEKKVWLLWKDNLGFTDQLTARTLYQKAQNPPMNIFLLGEKIARLKNTQESDFFFFFMSQHLSLQDNAWRTNEQVLPQSYPKVKFLKISILLPLQNNTIGRRSTLKQMYTAVSFGMYMTSLPMESTPNQLHFLS